MSPGSKLVHVALALLLALPVAALMTPAASAADTVPIAPTIPWQNQGSHEQLLYLTYPTQRDPGDVTTVPNKASCTSTADTPDPNTATIEFRPQKSQINDASGAPDSAVRQPCPYTAGFASQSAVAQGVASFRLRSTLLHDINVTGNDSIHYVHQGIVDSSIKLTVKILVLGSDGSARVTLQEDVLRDRDGNTIPTPFHLPNGALLLHRGDNLRVEVSGVADSAQGTGVPGTAPTWTLEDYTTGGLAGGTRLTFRSLDALKAATWVEDEAGNVRSLFRPLDRTLPSSARMVGFFAVQSAFNLEDAKGYPDITGIAPKFTLETGGQAQKLKANGDTILEGEFNRSVSEDGRAVWTFPAGFLDYKNFAAGEYNLTVDMDYHQGGSFRDGTRSLVLITTQNVRLEAYRDASVQESNAHDVGPGATSTYLFLVNNSGSANDTFRIDIAFVSGQPAGWAAQIGGPQVSERQVHLAPQESKLVTVTVTAPTNAPAGSTSIFQLQAVSTVDPTAKSTATTVVSTVSNVITRDVRIITFQPTLGVVPGEETRVPVYVWNRGTRFGTVALEVQGAIQDGWTVLVSQSDTNGVSRIVLPSIPAGGIVAADVRVTGPVSQAEGSQDATINATQTDASGTAFDLPMRFVLAPVSGVKVQVFDAILGQGHIAEVTGNFTGTPGTSQTPGTPITDPKCTQNTPASSTTSTQGVGCRDDGLDGVWWRVWVTNTGRRTEQFDLSVPENTIVHNACDQVFSKDPPEFFHHQKNGDIPARSTMTLRAGETGEIYAWKPVNKTRNAVDPNSDRARQDPASAPCKAPNDAQDYSFQFVIIATGHDSKVTGRAGARVVAEDKNGAAGQGYEKPVYLEHVQRRNTYTSDTPVVDIANATRRSITVGVAVNTTRSVLVRLTNGASFAPFEDPVTHEKRTSEVTVSLQGVDHDRGWNASIRPVNPDLQSNPYVDTLTFSNVQHFRREGWADYEIEVRMQAPDGQNGTGLAGEQDQFTLQASIPGGDTNTLEFSAVITQLANVSVEADTHTIFAHPGSAGASLVYVNNTGSSEARVKLGAFMDPVSTPNAQAWTVEPASQSFTLAAFKNATIALLVTPPQGAASGELVVSAEFAPNPLEPLATLNHSDRVTVQVVARGSLTLTANSSDVTIVPGGFANYTLNLVNIGSLPVNYEVGATAIPNWSSITLAPQSGTIGAGQTQRIDYVLKAPVDVVNGSRFSSVVRVAESGNPQNFDIKPVTVSILGGHAIPSLAAPKLLKTVDRNGETLFEVVVRNLGSATSAIALTTRSGDSNWPTSVKNLRGDTITSITLSPNEAQVVNVSVRAPLNVAENTIVPVEVVAESGGQAAKVNLQALVHDYGVALSLTPSRVDAVPGLPAEFVINLRNTGNDNDTLNVSANLVDIPEWRVDLSLERVRLEPGQSTDVRAVVRSPTAPLPTPRAYTLKFFGGTVGGVAVNIPKNDSTAAVVNILNYRPMDVDRDDQLEVAVDYDKNSANGFERFYEILPDGVQSVVVATAKLNGKTSFFLDVPRDRPVDGIADVWFDPETVYAYDIKFSPDVSGDNAPDYFLDTNHDGKIDKAYDTSTQQFFDVTEIKAYGDERIQYLVDTNHDGKPDRFYDGEKKLVTRTQPTDNPDQVGIDTDNDGKVDKVYDVKTTRVSDARISGASSFFVKYWYFFVGFAVLVLVTIALIVRRRR